MLKEYPVVIQLSILGYLLNGKQNAIANYLIPAIFGCCIFIAHFTVDLTLVYKLYCEEEDVWAGLTLLFIYLPVIGCFILTVSSWEMWPNSDSCDVDNLKWFFIKFIQHLCFPIWSMWRYAEKIFWSIEAIRAVNEECREDALCNASAPRSIEFYFFLKGFLQTIPQILLQMQILMRHIKSLDKETIDIQAASIFLNISTLAATTVLYQRFKTQKIGGKNYPWFKPYKYNDSIDSKLLLRNKYKRNGFIYCTKDSIYNIKETIQQIGDDPVIKEDVISTASSDLYMEPNLRDTVIDDEIDFPQPLRLIYSIPEDDLAVKVLSFCWWLCFLIARFLAISTFAYFFPKEIIWILTTHFLLCVAFLLYDAKAYVVRRTKAVFFIFIGIIYLFCIIEFKKQFKRTRFIYNGYFILVFTENFVMCCIWWWTQLDDSLIDNDWWFHYVFYVVLLCTFLSFLSMAVYNIVRARKVAVATATVPEKL